MKKDTKNASDIKVGNDNRSIYYCLEHHDIDNEEILVYGIKIAMDFLNQLVTDGKNKKEIEQSEIFRSACDILIMTLSKKNNLLALVKNTNSFRFYGTTIIDPIPAILIVRSIYESLIVFHYYFFLPDTIEKKEFLFNLWKLKGLKNLKSIKLKTSNEDLSVINNQYDLVEKKIHESYLYLANKKKLDNIRKDVMGVKILDDNTLEEVTLSNAWKDLFLEYEEDKNVASVIYKYFSFMSHASFLSVQQFERQFSGDYLTPIIQFSNLCTCKLINEFITAFPHTKNQFEQINPQYKKYYDIILKETKLHIDET